MQCAAEGCMEAEPDCEVAHEAQEGCWGDRMCFCMQGRRRGCGCTPRRCWRARARSGCSSGRCHLINRRSFNPWLGHAAAGFLMQNH